MTTDLIATTFTAWALFGVAGSGIAALPWTDAELRASVQAFATVGRAVVGLAR
jgi:hypothetical protein